LAVLKPTCRLSHHLGEPLYLWRSIDATIACAVVFLGLPLVCDVVTRFGDRAFVLDALATLAMSLPHALFLASTMFHATAVAASFLMGLAGASWGATPKDSRPGGGLAGAILTMWRFRRMYAVLVPVFAVYVTMAVVMNVGLYRAWGVPFFAGCHLVAPLIFA